MITHSLENDVSLGILQNNPTPLVSEGGQVLQIAKQVVRYALQERAGLILPEFRVSYCMRRSYRPGRGADLWYSPDVKKAHYKGLMTCNSVWVCPVCNAKILYKRAMEIKEAVEKNDLNLLLVTFTIQHNLSDPLEKLIKDMNGAINYLKKNKKYYDKIKKDFSLVGNITSMEVRYSKITGWHPHKHSLFIVEKIVNKAYLKNRLEAKYNKYLADLGYLVNEHTIDIQFSSASDYITKWGLEMEVTGGAYKSGEVSISPFNLINLLPSKYREYAETTKGKRAVIWSNGLKKKLSIVIKSDKELNEEISQESFRLLDISKKAWLFIVKNKMRGSLLSVAETGDIQTVVNYLYLSGVPIQEDD